MKKHKLPSHEVLKQYHPGIQIKLMQEYHRKLASKHRWFISEFGGENYYVDGDELPKISADIYEVIDCRWNPEKWDTQPFKYKVFKDEIVEEFHSGDSLPYPDDVYKYYIIGLRKNGKWVYKEYKNGNNLSFWIDKDHWWLRKDGIITRYLIPTKRLFSGTFENQIEVKSAKEDYVIPVLRAMKAKKWRGFYDDGIKYVIETARVDIKYL